MIKKLQAMLGLKGILCIAALTVIALALVNYTATITITPIKPFTVGAITDYWGIYVNDVDEIRYLPGDPGSANGTIKPEPPVYTNTSTYAFHVVTDANKVCAVKIELTAPVNNTKFTKFEITVLRWNATFPGQWQSETLYDAESGTTAKVPAYIDGRAADVGYVHQEKSEEHFYLIQVTYSYEVDETTPVYVTFQYTPLPRDSW